MAGSAAVLEDSSLLSKLDRALEPIERFCAYLSGFAVFSLMFLAFYFVSSRTAGYPSVGYEDVIVAIMPLIAIMGVSYVQRDGSHIRMDMLVGALKGRALWLFELISVLLIMILVLGLIYGSYAHFDRSFDCSRPLCSMDSTGTIYLPLWPSKLLVPIALSVLALRLFLQVWGYARALVYGLEAPAGVPMKLSVAEQARLEAKSVEGSD